MARGHIDSLTTAGLIEGWAFDETRPIDPLRIRVTSAEGVEIAAGYANLFRRDLAEAGHAFGWCHFRLALDRPVEEVSALPLRLIEAESGAVICAAEPRPVREEAAHEIHELDELVRNDPTVLASVDQLEGFEDALRDFVAREGVEAFMHAAYVYVLGRAIDATGLTLYGRLLQNNRLSPYTMLLTLADSQEFRSKTRALAAPGRAAFPFRVA